MGAFEEYLKPLLDNFDVSGLLDPDVESIESDLYVAPVIYKYSPSSRRSFFAKPQFRFSQREALNDPFEMSTRWKTASANALKALVRQQISETLPKVLLDKQLQKEIFNEQISAEGKTLSAIQATHLDVILESEAFSEYIKQLSSHTDAMTAPLLHAVFSKLELEFDSIVGSIVGKSGILSLTEDPLNQLMWAHYAESGAGFVVGFDAQNDFFLSKDAKAKRHLLRKVKYTDDRIDNFWRNPYYLFLVKSSGWAYEREWRMLKTLSECDEQGIKNKSLPVCLCNVPPDMIRTVCFGFEYDPAQISNARSALKSVGANPTYHTVRVNRTTGTLEAHEI